MVKAVSFGHKHDKNKHVIPAGQFMEMSDRELWQLSQIEANTNKKAKKEDKHNSLLFAIVPIADAFSNSLHPANTADGTIVKSYSKFMKPFTNTLVRWGLFLGAFAALDYVTDKSEKLSKFKCENPIQKFALDILAVVGGTSLLSFMAAKSNASQTPKAQNLARRYFKEQDAIRDNSWFANKVYKPVAERVSEFAGKHTKLTKIANRVIPYGFAIALSAYALKALVLTPMARKKRTEENFDDLKMVQDNFRSVTCETEQI